METGMRIIWWIGFSLVAGVGLLAVAGVWWGACTLALKCYAETHWIATWALYKKRSPKAYMQLEKAIRADLKNGVVR